MPTTQNKVGGMMKLSKNVSRILSLTALVVALIAEMLPNGAVLMFAPGPDERIRQTFSYFSLIPFGYANFFTLPTAILTVVVTLLSVIILLKKGKVIRLQKVTFFCTAPALLLSIMPLLLFGTLFVTVLGVVITAMLLLSLAFQAHANKRMDGLLDKVGSKFLTNQEVTTGRSRR